MYQALLTASPERCRTTKLKTYTVTLEISLCVAGLWGLHNAAVLVVSLSLWLSSPNGWDSIHSKMPQPLCHLTVKKPQIMLRNPNYHLLNVLCISYTSPCLQMSSIHGIAGSRQCWILHCVLSLQLLTASAQGKLVLSVTQPLYFLSLDVAEEKYLAPGL